MQRIPHAVTERLGHYVYAYVRPKSGQITYVGKGQGQRALAHLLRLPRQRVDILAHGLPDEAAAFAVETAVIDALGLDRLTNRVSGKQTKQLGRTPLSDLVFRYGARRINIRDPSVLIRISQLYRSGMTASELYEATRGVWVVGKRRETCKYAMAVHHGIVREVYRIRSWHPGGTTRYRHRTKKKSWADRWEFLGSPAEPAICRRYIGGSVEHLLPDGAQNPIRYVP